MVLTQYVAFKFSFFQMSQKQMFPKSDHRKVSKNSLFANLFHQCFLDLFKWCSQLLDLGFSRSFHIHVVFVFSFIKNSSWSVKHTHKKNFLGNQFFSKCSLKQAYNLWPLYDFHTHTPGYGTVKNKNTAYRF